MALAATFGADVLAMINQSKVLVVGAGGIGCELLKNLVSSGFKDIATIDLDTIEVSNLNRQFLFRKEHVGQSKAQTAASAVKQFDASVCVCGHLGNIKCARFGAEYFAAFDIVLNALDNTAARRHVNRLCLSTARCFVESGTQGFLGQVLPILPRLSQCWECSPKEANQRTYAVCTIRSTPDKAVHCVVWAKLMFALLFGADADANIIKDLKVERKHSETNAHFAQSTFEFLFETDIREQRAMTDKWKERAPPQTICFADISDSVRRIRHLCGASKDKMHIRSTAENAAVFLSSMSCLLARASEEARAMLFDKDDGEAMSFVASAANLRMCAYGIACESEFAVKGIAGNIIHAIATTNAITAGCMVVQAVHILQMHKDQQQKEQQQQQLRECSTRQCWVNCMGPKWLLPQSMEPPNAQCFICQKSVVHLTLDAALFTFGDFVRRILQKTLGFKMPDIQINENYIEAATEDDDAEERAQKLDRERKALDDAAIKIFDGSRLVIEDFAQDVTVHLDVHYLELDAQHHPNGFEVTNGLWSAHVFKKAEQSGGGSKRKATAPLIMKDAPGPPSKKQKI